MIEQQKKCQTHKLLCFNDDFSAKCFGHFRNAFEHYGIAIIFQFVVGVGVCFVGLFASFRFAIYDVYV